MATDDLNTPLGPPKARRRRFTVPISLPQALAGALGLVALVFAGWAITVEDPLGGEPRAVVSIDPGKPGAASTAALMEVRPGSASRYDGPPRDGAAPAGQGLPPGAKTVTIIDGSSGKRQEVVVGGATGEAKGAVAHDAMLEQSPHGALPRIGENGARPAEAFAQPAPAAKPGAPRVAIIVGGLGISAKLTSEALAKLPGPITLAFAPYGSDLDRLAARARSEGHEVLLQLPMEPFDYPDNDPGPQTLLTSLPSAQNLDRLHWLLGRFHGYVGVTNFMGARFTATDKAMAPILKEVGKRGLIYVDDGASPRSVADHLASGNNVPFAKAEVVLDAVAKPVEIDRALTRLEATARDRGIAVGSARALPVSIERIARWAKSAASRGIVLVPITAAALKAKSS